MIKFKDDELLVAGLSLAAPLRPYGQVRLFDAVKELTHDQLELVARELSIPSHGLIDTYRLMLMVGSSLQKQWFTKMGDVPANVEKNYAEQWKEHTRHVANLQAGRVEMKKKQQKTRKAKQEAKPKTDLTYRLLSSKVEGKLAKQLENKEAKGHDVILLQALSGLNGDTRLADVVAAVKDTGRYKTKDKLDASVRYHLGKLEKAGLVSAKEVAAS